MSFTHFDITTKNALITLRSERANILASADSSKMAMWLTHSEAEELRDRLTAALEISRQQIDAARAPSVPIDKTDKQKIRQAFLALRKAGWFARMGFSKSIPSEYQNSCVYYDSQAAAEAFDESENLTRSLFLFWFNNDNPMIDSPVDCGSPAEIIHALRHAGLNARWDGRSWSCVEIKHSALEGASARA